MKKVFIVIWFLGTVLTLNSQPGHFSHDDNFTRQYMHQHYGPSHEIIIFNRSWNHLINTYIATANFSNRLSSVSSFDLPTENPEVLLSEYYEKIDQLNTNFVNQQEANNAMIDQSIRGLGELAADFARDNKITTKDPWADFFIKEIAIGAVQERTKQKNAENLELQRSELQRTLESNLSTKMAEIRDQMLSDNSQLRDKYLEAMAYEADNSKEAYYASCYDYYDCFVEQIKSEYSYNSSSWYKPNCKTPREDYSTSIKPDYTEVAFRKLDLYKKYNNEIFLDAVNIFLDAGLAENRQNPQAFFLKSQLEKDIIERMFYANLAVTFDPENNEYKSYLRGITNTFNLDFYTAIRNNNTEFISLSIEKGFHLGREHNGRTAIETAIDFDKADILEMLINSIPEEKNTLSKNGTDLLFHACAVDALEVVKKLISMGVNPEYKDKNLNGLTALNLAEENNSQKVMLYLASNYSIKPALLFSKKSGQDDLSDFSYHIYEAVPAKLADIRSVYPKFNPDQVNDNLTTDVNLKTEYESTGTSDNNVETEIRDVTKHPDFDENKSGSLHSDFSATSNTDADSNNEGSFKSGYGTFTDSRDGKEYGWVKINNQIWMSENLAYIPSNEGAAWIYEAETNDLDDLNNSPTCKTYGILYTYHTAIQSCPGGWRVPSDLEWSKLENFLDNTVIDFNQISYRGTTIGSKLIMTKPGSLKAKFGGKRMANGKYIGIENIGSYWTSSRSDDLKVWTRQLQKNLPQIIRAKTNENEGNSVRCVRIISTR
jgi:uncharacterized protein (TIGR02145 family)